MGNQNTYLAETVESVSYYSADVSGDGKVSWDGQNVLLRSHSRQLDLRSPEIGFSSGADCNVGTFLSERKGNCSSHAPAGSSNDSNPIFKS